MPDVLGKLYRAGEPIVRQGEKGSQMYVLQRGRVEVIRESEGREDRLGLLGPGAVFGEMAIFEREVRSATIRAVEDARVLTIDRRTFLRRVQEDPSLAFHILRSLSHRVRELDDEVARLRARLDAGRGEPVA
ncbi:MAG TPA: cyclic nucleotide-binding domain-containing protein [Thermoanaerobaculia bacterium]